ncbi:hypothetical protein V3C99_011522, partial [Haemonchus contortus]
IPAGKYLSSKFVGRLFPTTFDEKRHVLRRLPAIELMRLEPFLYNRPLKPSSINSVVQSTPPLRTQPFFTLKVLCLEHFFRESTLSSPSCTGLSTRRSVKASFSIIEAKDFFIPGPDRRELHLIVLDQYATNVASNTRGLLLSVKDLVCVYTVEPTRAALRNRNKALKEARIPKANALVRRFSHFFQVK